MTKRTKERPFGQAAKLAKRAALDRVLQAALAEARDICPGELRRDAALTALHRAATWLLYAVHRADALASSKEERLPRRTPAEHLETMHDCEADDPLEEVDAKYHSLRELARELDPGYEKPIRKQADWLDIVAPRSLVGGQRVALKADEAEGWPRQRGTYQGPSGRDCHVVSLDRRYRNGKADDGLREVTTEQIEVLP